MSNSKWVCFACRSTYSREHRQCPTCGGEVLYIGKFFKPPKHSADKAWQAIKILHDAGIRYDHDWTSLNPALIKRYHESKAPLSQRELLHILNNAAWYYVNLSKNRVSGKRPQHPREAEQLLAEIAAQKQQLFDVVQAIADQIGRDHPDVRVALSRIKEVGNENT